MSVYTTVEPAQLEPFLKRYALGRLRALQPITAGITNTNYCLDTDRGAFVLTLYEHHSDDELDYMLGLQLHLARRGELFSTLNRRPAAIIDRLGGAVVSAPGSEHCALIGAELARFHLAGRDFTGYRPNPRGAGWLQAVRDKLDGVLDDGERQLVAAILQEYLALDTSGLPGGAIHADLFRDNALFIDTDLGGIFDFDYACDGSYVFDLAVTLNDWCIDAGRELEPMRVDALLAAYRELRPLAAVEIGALPTMLRLTALRFWLSRLHDRTYPLAGELTWHKNPDEFRRLLQYLLARGPEIEALFLPHQVG